MKNIYKIFLLSLLVFAVSCENEDDSRFTANPETGWMQFTDAETTIAVTPRTTPIMIGVEFTAPINTNSITVSYAINSVSGTPSSVVTGLGSSLVIAPNTNLAFIELTPVDDAVQQLIDGGDVVFDIELTTATGGAGIGLSDGSATITHTVNLLCGGEPEAGIYTIDMHDSFGDGWQTDDGNGGSGMTATLTDLAGEVTVIEFGMCSPYGSSNEGTFLDGNAAGALCQPWAAGTNPSDDLDFLDATTTITVPPGTIDLIFDFPGDNWGEISFEIYKPNGDLLYASGNPGDQGAGELAVSFCQ